MIWKCLQGFTFLLIIVAISMGLKEAWYHGDPLFGISQRIYLVAAGVVFLFCVALMIHSKMKR